MPGRKSVSTCARGLIRVGGARFSVARPGYGCYGIPAIQYETLAAVDLGSNSFHLQIGRVVDDQIYLLDGLREQVRLGAD